MTFRDFGMVWNVERSQIKGCLSGFWENPECGTQPEIPEVMFGFQDNSEREPRLIFPKRNFQDSGGYLNVARGQGITKAFFSILEAL